MKTPTHRIVAVSLWCIGIASVYICAWGFWTLTTNEAYSENALLEATVVAATLQRYRDGDVEGAVNLLEGTLDRHLLVGTVGPIGVGALFPPNWMDQYDRNELLCKSADYRKRFPSPSQETKELVRNALKNCW